MWQNSIAKVIRAEDKLMDTPFFLPPPQTYILSSSDEDEASPDHSAKRKQDPSSPLAQIVNPEEEKKNVTVEVLKMGAETQGDANMFLNAATPVPSMLVGLGSAQKKKKNNQIKNTNNRESNQKES